MIHKVLITDKMLFDAEWVAEQRRAKQGESTNPISSDRDVIGALAEMAVEQEVKDWHFSYNATWKDVVEGGDSFDLKVYTDYEPLIFDVKGSSFTYDWDNRDENEVHIWDSNYHSLDKVEHLIFCRVWKKSKVIYILGTMSVNKFRLNEYLVEDQWGKRHVCKTKHLQDLRYFLSNRAS